MHQSQLTARIQCILTESLLGEVVRRKLGDNALDELALDAARAIAHSLPKESQS